jgi:hypothetical protein
MMEVTEADRAALRVAHEQGQTIPCRHCGLDGPGDPPGCEQCHGTGSDFCETHCPICEGMDHHWMPDCDEHTGAPRMACKHCPAIREYVAADADDDGEDDTD